MTTLGDLRPVPRSNPATTVVKAGRLVDERTGVIRLVYENPAEADGPAMFGYGSLLADTTQFGVPATEPLNGSTSVDRTQALAGAIGEAVERYAGRMVPQERLVTAPVNNPPGQGVDPHSLVLYSPEQYRRQGFPYPPVSDDLTIRWVEGYSLTRDTAVWVPAFAVYIPYPWGHERPLVELTTNGLACGNTLEEAVLSGLTEIVERHAAMSMWLTRSKLPQLRCVTTTDPVLQKTLRVFDSARYDVHLLDGSAMLGIPVVISVAIDRSGRGPAATFASAASLSPCRAAVGALEELAQCYFWLKSLMAKRPPGSILDLRTLSSVEDHVFWATALDHLPMVEFAVASPTRRDINDLTDLSGRDVRSDIEACTALLADRGLEVIAVDVTSPDIEEVGLHVARVLVPGTQPLFFGSGCERLSPLLPQDVPLNPDPHPFP